MLIVDDGADGDEDAGVGNNCHTTFLRPRNPSAILCATLGAAPCTPHPQAPRGCRRQLAAGTDLVPPHKSRGGCKSGWESVVGPIACGAIA